MEIVNDRTKFSLIGTVSKCDKTAIREREIKDILESLMIKGEISEKIYEETKPFGSVRPRLYGLPKTHKLGNPLRPILSMISSPQHKLARYLNDLLSPVLKHYSTFTVKDSFDFAAMIRETEASNTYMASFDVKSLFTNVPLEETIDICTESLYKLEKPRISKDSFKELMMLATSSVEFSFNEHMYQQNDGVSMGSPLGPTLACIFMGFIEKQYFKDHNLPLKYCRYVDDCFILFKDKNDCSEMFKTFNTLHASISFTMETEENNILPFLDVLITRQRSKFVTTVYRKQTFTGQYINFRSHCSLKRKTNLIKTLFDRATKICSPESLDAEVDNISRILQDNSYPEDLIRKTIERHSSNRNHETEFGPDRRVIPIKLQYLGKHSRELERKLKSAVNDCYFSVSPRCIFSSRPILNHCHKDPIEKTDQTLVIYQYQCYCGSSYVGRTGRRLGVRMKEHVPRCVKLFIENPQHAFSDNITLVRAAKKSSIANHLLENPECGKSFDWTRFKIVHKCKSLWQLKVLEAVTIASVQPDLNKQTEFDFATTLI